MQRGPLHCAGAAFGVATAQGSNPARPDGFAQRLLCLAPPRPVKPHSSVLAAAPPAQGRFSPVSLIFSADAAGG